MKKSLLLSFALLGSVCAFAQEGTNVTPDGYKFNQITSIPWFDNGYGAGTGFYSAANYLTDSRSGKGVWLNLGSAASEYWNKNNGLMGCAFVADEEDMNIILDGFQLVNLGGEVGQVLCWQGKDSNLKECLQSNYPNVSWDHIPAPITSNVKQSFNLNFFLNPNDVWTKGLGYYRVRLVLNACHHATDADIENEIYDFSGENVIKEMYQVNNQGNNTSFIYDGTVNDEGQKVNTSTNDVGVIPSITNDLFTKRTASGGLVENEWGDPVWDPTKWVIVDYYFNVAGDAEGVDEKGDATVPARIKLGLGAKLNTLAILIKEFSITKFDGDLTQGIYDLNKGSFATAIYTPGEAGAVETPSDAPEMLYMIGDGPGWTPGSPLQASSAANGVFTFTDVTLSNETSYFSFINTVSDNWDLINDGEHRYGPAEGTDAAITVGAKTQFSIGGDTSWNMPGGTYTFVMNFNDHTLSVSAGAGVSSILDENAPVEFYNLQGVKVVNPQNGIFIRKQGKNTSKVIMK